MYHAPMKWPAHIDWNQETDTQSTSSIELLQKIYVASGKTTTQRVVKQDKVSHLMFQQHHTLHNNTWTIHFDVNDGIWRGEEEYVWYNGGEMQKFYAIAGNCPTTKPGVNISPCGLETSTLRRI